MSCSPLIKRCLRFGVGVAVVILILWWYYRAKLAVASVNHLLVLNAAPSMLLSAAESWALDEKFTDDQVRVVDSNFIDVLYGKNLLNRVYLTAIDRNDFPLSDMRYTVVIDGDHDGLFKGVLHLARPVSLMLELSTSGK